MTDGEESAEVRSLSAGSLVALLEAFPSKKDKVDLLRQHGFRKLIVIRGPAKDWQICGRLEMDRHKGKASNRAPRWNYFSPWGQEYTVLKSKDRFSKSVQHIQGLEEGA